MELKAIGFAPIHADPCVYAYKRGRVVLIISLYVDDLLLASDSLDELERVKADLQNCFDMDDMGEATFALGIKITRDRTARTLTISQGAYIEEVLTRFDMQDCRPVSTPMEPKAQLAPIPPAKALDATEKTQYQSAVGALLHAARATRPDISFAVTAPDQTDSRSITGYAFLLNGAAISWASRKQPTVAHSSTEAECMSASDAAKEAVWWRLFLSSLGYPMDEPTSIRCDNQGGICLSKNPEHHRKVKHIAVRHHYIREQVAAGTLTLDHVSTSQMAADVLTKPLKATQHGITTKLLGITAASA